MWVKIETFPSLKLKYLVYMWIYLDETEVDHSYNVAFDLYVAVKGGECI